MSLGTCAGKTCIVEPGDDVEVWCSGNTVPGARACVCERQSLDAKLARSFIISASAKIRI